MPGGTRGGSRPGLLLRNLNLSYCTKVLLSFVIYHMMVTEGKFLLQQHSICQACQPSASSELGSKLPLSPTLNPKP